MGSVSFSWKHCLLFHWMTELPCSMELIFQNNKTKWKPQCVTAFILGVSTSQWTTPWFVIIHRNRRCFSKSRVVPKRTVPTSRMSHIFRSTMSKMSVWILGMQEVSTTLCSRCTSAPLFHNASMLPYLCRTRFPRTRPPKEFLDSRKATNKQDLWEQKHPRNVSTNQHTQLQWNHCCNWFPMAAGGNGDSPKCKDLSC